MAMNEYRLRKLLRDRVGLEESEIASLGHEAAKSESDLEDVVVRRGILSRSRLYEMLAEELNLPYVDLNSYRFDAEVLAMISAELCRKHQFVPLFRVNDRLSIATARPDDIAALDELHRTAKMEISPVVADPEAIRTVISQRYQPEPSSALDAAAVVCEADVALRFIEAEQTRRCLEDLASEAPVVRFVNSLLEQAVAERASDVHIEPNEHELRVRSRVDGLLRETGRFPTRLHAAVVSRVKILAGMDISDRRRPQDGRFDFRVASRELDVRVSTFPTIWGENIVMRLLDKSASTLRLTELGLDEATASRFERVLRQPHGIILVTGPTGSGKTTTLYSMLTELNSEERNIITLEDPVEYRLPRIRQCQVSPKAGVTFASGLRSILRQDPDVILVGEIRDAETAEIAFQSALTGHLVLSTLHTNDAASTLTRLLDMNLEPFLVSSSILAVLAQRLCRRVCQQCREEYRPAVELTTRLRLNPEVRLVRGRGCSACSGRGYRGRLGIFELLTMNPAIRQMIMTRQSAEEIREQAVKQGMRTLREDALAKAQSGLTTVEEVLRVTQDCEIASTLSSP